MLLTAKQYGKSDEFRCGVRRFGDRYPRRWAVDAARWHEQSRRLGTMGGDAQLLERASRSPEFGRVAPCQQATHA